MRYRLVAVGAASFLMACSGVSPSVGEPSREASPWQPSPGTTWQWQLSGTIDQSVDVRMYDVDLFETPTTTVDTLHSAGRIVICYFSAGSHEDWRPDQSDIPAAALGKPLDVWPGEHWLDVRRTDVRAFMEQRLDRAVAKHCDGVEPDNVDAYANDSGFDLTAGDELDFNRFLARAAHTRGLSVGLKNDLEQVDDLIDDFDWALNEECYATGECAKLTPFVAAGKAVFHTEYVGEDRLDEVCAETVPLRLSTILKKTELDSWRAACSDR